MSKVFRVSWVKIINKSQGFRRVPLRMMKIKRAIPRVKNTSKKHLKFVKR